MNDFYDILSGFNSYGLDDEKKLSLMKRIDTKYVFHKDQLHQILKCIDKGYLRLDIGSHLIPSYKTIYFDTADYSMYTSHHNGKLNRYKIRQREYIDSKQSFLEIKFKTNKRITDKSRIVRNSNDDRFSDTEKSFIANSSSFLAEELAVSVSTSFDRITLANFSEAVRVTIDSNLCFYFKDKTLHMEDLIICEVKKEHGKGMSKLEYVLRENKIKPFKVSKYCLGNYFLNDAVKHNLYKVKGLYINKILRNNERDVYRRKAV